MCIGAKFVLLGSRAQAVQVAALPSWAMPEVTQVSADRSVVRAAGRNARRSVSGRDREDAERLLISHLKSVHVVGAPCVGAFVAHDGEPDLAPLVDWIWEQGRSVSLPILNDDPDDFTMQFVPWHPDDELRRGRYGIPVPPRRPPVQPDTLLVSLTGFDRYGNRMGRGAGFFDRYLSESSAAVVGVGLEVQRFDAMPIEAHDERLPMVVTDLGIRYTDQIFSTQRRGKAPRIGKD